MDKSADNLDAVKCFNGELASLYESKPPISKAKMVQVTKSAMKAIKYYKHVVMSVEKFIQKCRPEYKLPGLYVIDSIVRQSRHQYGAEKDVFAPRFSKNIAVTFQSLFKCSDEDKSRVVRVIRLWLKNGVFSADDLRPLLEIAASQGVDIPDSATDQNGQEDDIHARKHTPSPEVKVMASGTDRTAAIGDGGRQQDQQNSGNLDPTVFSQLQKLTNVLLTTNQRAESDRNLTKKLLADYEYSDEESGGEDEPGAQQTATEGQRHHDLSANLAAAAQNLLKNPELLQQIHEMQQSMRGPTGQLQQGTMENQQQRFQHPPPPAVLNMQQQVARQEAQLRAVEHQRGPHSAMSPPPQPPFVQGHENQGANYPPPAEPLPPESYGRPHWPANKASERLLDRDERKRGPAESTRRRSRSRSKDRRRDRRGSRSRSRSRSGSRSGRGRNRSRSTDRRARDRENERERRKQGLPPMKQKQVSICSRTLWFGRVPTYCEAHEIKDGLKDYGEPQSIDLITPRGCAYVVMPDRKSAYKVLDRLKDSLKIQNRVLKMAWAPGKGVKEYKDGWDVDNGVTYLPWDCLPNDLTGLLDGGSLDVESLPEDLKGSYSESGRLETSTSSEPPIQANFQPVPPPFAAFASVPPPSVFSPGMLPPSYPPLSMVPLPGSTQGRGPVMGVPPPSVAPPSVTALNTGLRPPLPSAAGVMSESTETSHMGQLVPPMPLYSPAGHPHLNPPPNLAPNYARPVNVMEGRPRFMPPHHRGGGGHFDGPPPPPPPFRGRGRGMRGGDFWRGNSFRGGAGGPRRDWSMPQPSSRFDSGVRNGGSRWSMAGDGRRSRDYDTEDTHPPRRSRWSNETENFPRGGGDPSDSSNQGTSIPVIGSSSWQPSDLGSEEPPPPGE